MKKIFFIFLFCLSQCGFQPIYLNKELNNNEFKNISFEGNQEINEKIINSLSLKENKLNNDLKSLILRSSYKIEEIKKDSSGKIELYKSQIELNLIIKKQNQVLAEKKLIKELSYNAKDNKFELVQYQNIIKNDLINRIIEDIILYLNI